PPRHGDLAALGALLRWFADVAGINRGYSEVGSPSRGPTMRGSGRETERQQNPRSRHLPWT
ncbi:MAG: hypothetical protein AAGK79_20940, partial [Pseudomonadota bacterium]